MLKHSLSHSLALVTPIEFQLVIWLYVLSKPVKLKVDYKVSLLSHQFCNILPANPHILWGWKISHGNMPRSLASPRSSEGDPAGWWWNAATPSRVCASRMQQMQITWEFRCLHATGIKWVWISVNFKASGRSRDGQMAARRWGIRLHHAWNFFQSQARIARNVAMFFLACRNTPWKSLCTDSSETGHSLSWWSLQSRLTSRDYAFIRDCTHQEMGWMTHHFPLSLVGHTWGAWCCMMLHVIFWIWSRVEVPEGERERETNDSRLHDARCIRLPFLLCDSQQRWDPAKRLPDIG